MASNPVGLCVQHDSDDDLDADNLQAVTSVNLSDHDLIRLADILSDKMNCNNVSSKPPSPIKDMVSSVVGQDSGSCSNKSTTQKVQNAHLRAKRLLDSLNKQVDNQGTVVDESNEEVVTSDVNSQSRSRSLPSDNDKSSVDDGFHFSDDGLFRFISHVRNLPDGHTTGKKRKLDDSHNVSRDDHTDNPPLGAFGEIMNKSSLLAMNRQRDGVGDWENSDLSNFHARLLKSGLNRSYNDLVVREIIWPNDLVLRGSEKVKLLEMTHSGILPGCAQNDSRNSTEGWG